MTDEIKNPTCANKQGNKKTKKQKYDTKLAAQRARLLVWLRERPISTVEARKYLDILAPAPRIYELRHDENFNILTHWCDEATDQGVTHRVARYVLHPGKYKEMNHVKD